MTTRGAGRVVYAPRPWEPDPRGWARWQRWISTAVRLALAAAVLRSGVHAMADLPASARAVRSYDMLPELAVVPVGYGLPIVEAILGVLLLLGLLTRPAATALGMVLLGFLAGIVQAWVRELPIECGCFGGGGVLGPGEYVGPLLWVVVLGLGTVFLGIWPWSRVSLDRALGIDPLR